MTTAFEIIVTQNGDQNEETAIANATNHLSTLATELNISESNVFDVNVYDGDDDRDYGIGICIAFSDITDVTEESLLISLDNEDNIESVEEVHYEEL